MSEARAATRLKRCRPLMNHGPSPPDGAMVSRFERGEREPNLYVIVAYARLAKVSTDVLIDGARSISDLVKEIPQR